MSFWSWQGPQWSKWLSRATLLQREAYHAADPSLYLKTSGSSTIAEERHGQVTTDHSLYPQSGHVSLSSCREGPATHVLAEDPEQFVLVFHPGNCRWLIVLFLSTKPRSNNRIFLRRVAGSSWQTKLARGLKPISHQLYFSHKPVKTPLVVESWLHA